MSSPIKLLMLDDSHDDAILIRRTLENSELSLEIIHVTTASQFKEQLSLWRPDIVLSDHDIPEFSSIQALHQARERFPFLPFVLVTGAFPDEYAADIIRAGADDYILKGNLNRLPTSITQAIQKKATEESLHRSEANLRSIFNNTDTGYILIDHDFKIVAFNELASMWSKVVTAIPLNIGESLLSYETEKNSERVEEFKRTLSIGDTFQYETRMDGPDKSATYYVRFLPVKLNGKVNGASIAISDISARIKTEQEVIIREQRFRALIENSSDAIVLNDREGHYLYQSPSVKRILGFDLEERKTGKVIDFVHPEHRDEFICAYHDMLNNPGKPIPFLYRNLHKDGHYIWLEGVVTNFLDNPNVHAFVANYRDVTARIKAEEALKLTLRYFEQAQEIAHLGHWQINLPSRATYWSDETYRILGLEPRSIPASQELFNSLIHPEDSARVVGLIQSNETSGLPFSFLHRIVRHNGIVRTIFTIVQFEFNKSLSPYPHSLYGISLDITELAEKEEQLKEVNKELETFAYKTYHDLRAPIATILGIINIARLDMSNKTTDYYDIIAGVTNKQGRMLKCLADAISIRNRELANQRFQVQAILDDLFKEFQSKVEANGIKLIYINECNEEVTLDRELFHDLMYHLVENAIHYFDNEKSESKIILTIKKHSDNVIAIDVEDNGVGIQKDIQDKIFEMFYRGNETSKGSGLGLYLVSNYIKKLGGNISVSSEERQGSVFKLTIPVS